MAKFLFCEHCKNLVNVICDSGIPLLCCGARMRELAANSSGRAENHLPDVRIEDERVLVRVGARPHPMIPEHYISWIALETDAGIYRQPVSICGPAQALFSIGNERPIAAYAFCNIHGLWRLAL